MYVPYGCVIARDPIRLGFSGAGRFYGFQKSLCLEKYGSGLPKLQKHDILTMRVTVLTSRGGKRHYRWATISLPVIGRDSVGRESDCRSVIGVSGLRLRMM